MTALTPGLERDAGVTAHHAHPPQHSHRHKEHNLTRMETVKCGLGDDEF